MDFDPRFENAEFIFDIISYEGDTGDPNLIRIRA